MKRVRWGKALLSGLAVWLIGSVVFTIPGCAYAFRRLPQIASTTTDPWALGEQLAGEIWALWTADWLLLALLIDLIMALGILLLSRALAKGAGESRWVNGLVVGAVPTGLTLVEACWTGFGVIDLVAMALYLGAGLVGGLLARA